MGDSQTRLAEIGLPEEQGNLFVVLLITAKVGYSSVVILARTEKYCEGDTFINNHTSKQILGIWAPASSCSNLAWVRRFARGELTKTPTTMSRLVSAKTRGQDVEIDPMGWCPYCP